MDKPPASNDASTSFPWGIEKKSLQPGALHTLSNDKLTRFAIGHQKKSRFQRDKEERQKKKQQAQIEAAEVYKTFVASFDNDPGTSTSSTFIRSSSSSRTRDSAQYYHLNTQPPPPSSSVITEIVAPPPSTTKKKKKKQGKPMREIDQMILEQDTNRMSHNCGTSSRSDERIQEPPSVVSTNLYVGNLHPETNEQELAQLFEMYGPIHSVKIMWPRSTEERQRQRNCGFINFKTRHAAEEALRRLQDRECRGHRLVIEWGKPVHMPTGILPPGDHNIPLQMQTPNVKAEGVPSDDPSLEEEADDDGSTRRIKIPNDLDIIHRMATFVAQYGAAFEDEMKRKERYNPQYYFLFEKNDDDDQSRALSSQERDAALYYRWKVYSLVMKHHHHHHHQKETTIPNAVVQWTVNGPRYSCRREATKQSSSSSSFLKSVVQPKGSSSSIQKLKPNERHEFEHILTNLTTDRRKIQHAMGFAIDHAEAANDIIHTIVRDHFLHTSLAQSSFQSKIALLYLVSDILHNSTASVSNSSSYRTNFQIHLPMMMEHLNVAAIVQPSRGVVAMIGRLTSQKMSDIVTRVLRAWESWALFPPLFLAGLAASYARPHVSDLTSYGSGMVKCISKFKEDYKEKNEVATKALVERMCRQSGLRIHVEGQDRVYNMLVSILHCYGYLIETFVPVRVQEQSENLVELQAQVSLFEDQLRELGLSECIIRMQDDPVGIAKEEPSFAPGVSLDEATVEASSQAAAAHPLKDQRQEDLKDIEEDLDGEPMEDDLDGEPMEDDLDGEPMEDDLDGEPMDDDDIEKNIDGEPMEDDLDGEPMEDDIEKNISHDE